MNATLEFFERLISKVPLRENERGVLIDRLRGKTFDEIASRKGRSRERVRQIEAKAVRQLGNAEKLGFPFMEDPKQRVDWLFAQLTKYPEVVNLAPDRTDAAVLDAPIEALGLPMKPYKVLNRSGLTSVRQLSELEDCALLELRSFGQKSLQLVRERLEAFLAVRNWRRT